MKHYKLKATLASLFILCTTGVGATKPQLELFHGRHDLPSSAQPGIYE